MQCGCVQVAPHRIFSAIRLPAFLVHVADAHGELSEKVCQELALHGRLTFHSLVANLTQGFPNEGDAKEEPLSGQVGSAIVRLMQERLVEQVGRPPFTWVLGRVARSLHVHIWPAQFLHKELCASRCPARRQNAQNNDVV